MPGSQEVGSLSPLPAGLGPRPHPDTSCGGWSRDVAVVSLSLQAQTQALSVALGLPWNCSCQGTLKAPSPIHSTNTLRTEAALRQIRPRAHPPGAPVGREGTGMLAHSARPWGGWLEPCRNGVNTRHSPLSAPRPSHHAGPTLSLPPPVSCVPRAPARSASILSPQCPAQT